MKKSTAKSATMVEKNRGAGCIQFHFSGRGQAVPTTFSTALEPELDAALGAPRSSVLRLYGGGRRWHKLCDNFTMSQFDAAATPMFYSFEATPDLRPYEALPANVDFEERNSEHACGSQLRMNFARNDAADDLLFNEVVWRSVRGVRVRTPGREGRGLKVI